MNAGYTEADANRIMSNVMKIETAIADSAMTREESRDIPACIIHVLSPSKNHIRPSTGTVSSSRQWKSLRLTRVVTDPSMAQASYA